MTRTSKKIATALASYAAAYRECFAGKLAVLNFDQAVAYAVDDVWNQVKRSPEALAVEIINDEAAYMLEKRAA